MFPKRNVVRHCALISAGVLAITGMLLMIFAPWFCDIIKNMILSLSTKPTFELWKKNPMPLYLEFYFFNWTNSHDIHKPNVKPHFQEIGPFVFEETKEKVNISWNSNNTVTFRHLRYWYFRENQSYANLSTKITTINAIALTAAHVIKDWSYVIRKGFDISIRSISTKLYKSTTVGELLFDGYEDPLINIAKSLPQMAGLSIPPYDKFGWFYERNGSYTFDGTYNMETCGVNFGEIKRWNYKEHLSYYEDECNDIKGSAGEFFSPNRTRSRIGFFSSDICRYVPLEYEQDVDVDGTQGYKYILGDGMLDNGTKVPENKCFCGDYCSPYGAVNISLCRYGAPGFVSLPHFYGADTYYLDKIQGLKPIKDKHQMFMIIEPTTGIPLHVEARLQLNLLVTPINSIRIFQGIPNFYFPVVWFEQKAKIPTMLHFLLKIFLYMELILRCTAGIMLIFGISWLIFLLQHPLISKICWKSSNRKAILPNTSDTDIKDCEEPLMNLNTYNKIEQK